MSETGGSRNAAGALRGRRAVITGASRGIGAAVAQRFAAEGAHVVITARTEERHDHLDGSLAITRARCQGYAGTVTSLTADLADPDSRATIVPIAEELLGGSIEVLVNNAAAGVHRPMETYSYRHRRLMFEVNFEAPLDLVQAVLPGMRARGEGWILNITSAAAQPLPGPPFRIGMPGNGIYAATKAAMDRATNQLAAELWGTGVRVNLLDPAKAVATEGTVAHLPDQPADFFEPVEVMAEACLVLCTCAAEMTGLSARDQTLLDELGRSIMTLDGRGPLSRS
jgi:citronellol/citronellal dehydrogenase